MTLKAILYPSVDNENREGNISTVKRGRKVGANFRRVRQIRQTPTTPGECGSDDHIRAWCVWGLAVVSHTSSTCVNVRSRLDLGGASHAPPGQFCVLLHLL